MVVDGVFGITFVDIGVLYPGGIDFDTLFEDEDVCWVFERV